MTEWWHEKSLGQLSDAEWEALCDGCGRCCLHKFEDEDSGEVLFTRVRCRYLDAESCRCKDYTHRSALVANCIALRTAAWQDLRSLPATCAYRLRAQGMLLPEWHPLVSGSRESVHAAGISVRGQTISDEHVHPDGYDEHIVQWIT